MPRFSFTSVATRAFWVLSFLLAALTAATAAAQADEQGWVLTQRSDKIGDQYVYVAPSGVKLVNPKIGYNIILCAPDWNVCIYNDKTKTYYSAAYDAWMKQVSQRMGGNHGSDLKSGHWARTDGSSICGLKATSYTMQVGGRSHLRNAKCWVANDIVVPQQITELLAQTYGLPDNKAYPLKLTTVSTSGKLNIELDTYNSQACAIPASYFYLPAGYTRVASQEEVMMDDDTKAILRDLANDSPSAGSSAGSSASAVGGGGRQVVRQQASQPQQQFQQQVQSQYAQPAQAQGQPVQQQQSQAAATPGVITLPNGQTLDKEKMRKIIDAIKNSGQTSTQTTPTR